MNKTLWEINGNRITGASSGLPVVTSTTLKGMLDASFDDVLGATHLSVSTTSLSLAYFLRDVNDFYGFSPANLPATRIKLYSGFTSLYTNKNNSWKCFIDDAYSARRDGTVDIEIILILCGSVPRRYIEDSIILIQRLPGLDGAAAEVSIEVLQLLKLRKSS